MKRGVMFIMRKFIWPVLGTLAVLGVVTVLYACAPAPAVTEETTEVPATEETVAEPTPPPEFDWKQFAGTEITLLLNEHPWTDGLRPYLKDFEALTGIKVNLQVFAEDLYMDKMELAVRGEKPIADVFMESMDAFAFNQWQAGKLASLTPFLNDARLTVPDYDFTDFPKGFLEATLYPPGDPNAEVYGIPITFEAYILFYNKALVDEYLGGEVPETMDELIAAADKVTQEAGEEGIYGSVMRGIRSTAVIDTMTGVVFNSWGEDPTPLPYSIWFDGAWDKPRLTDPRIVEGLSNYAHLMKSGPPQILVLDWYDANLLFQQGKIAFYIDASLFSPSFEDPEKSQIAGQVGYAPLPRTARGQMTAHWEWGLGIPANSLNKEAAWLFIQWATGKDMTAKIGRMTGGAPRLSTWDNPEYVEALNPDYVKAVQTVMETSRPTCVFHEKWWEAAILIVDAVHEIYGGGAPEAITEQYNQKILAVMETK